MQYSIANFRGRFSRAPAAAVLVCSTALLCGCPLVVGTVAGGAVAAAHDRRTAGQLVEDETIELKAFTTLSLDEEMEDGAHVNVTSFNGHVLLSGEVPSDQARAHVQSLVEGVDKVAWIFNELHVGASSTLIARSKDTAITAAAKSRMLLKDLDATHIKVVTERGIVYLMGLVTRAEGDIATEAARTTRGVVKLIKLFQYTD